jgi:hypothetical protein
MPILKSNLLTESVLPALDSNGLFSITLGSHRNACVGANGGPYLDSHYAEGYLDSALLLYEEMCRDTTSIQFGIYPLVFLYRHGIELSLKHLLRSFAYVNNTDAEPILNHQISENWRRLREQLELNHRFFSDEWRIKPNVLDWAQSIMMELNRIDGSSYTFRYARDKSGDWSIKQLTHVCPDRLHKYLNPLARWLVELTYCVGQIIDDGSFDDAG